MYKVAISKIAPAVAAGVFFFAQTNDARSEAPRIREPMTSATGLALGPIAFDAGFDELRAALPEADWEEVSVSPFSGRVFAIGAKDAIEIGGRRFSVESLQHYHDRRLRLSGAFEMESAADCDKATLEWLTAMEPNIGPFKAGEPRRTEGSGGGLYWSTTRQSNGGVIVTPSPRVGTSSKAIDERVSFGERSSALATIYDDHNKIVRRKNLGRRRVLYYDLEASNERNGANIKANASYVMTDGLCELSLVIALTKPTPEPEYFSFERATILSRPTIAERQFAVSLIENGLVSPRDYEFDCLISRLSARAEVCSRKSVPSEAGDDPDFAYKAARILAEQHEFDLSGFDRDDSAQLRSVIPVRLSPADLRSSDFSGRSRTPLSAVRIIAEPTERDAARAYSRIAGAAVGEAAVNLICEIQNDGSAICEVQSVNARDASALAAAAREVSLAYRFAPKLKDGKSSAGAVFEMVLRFAPLRPSQAETGALACRLFGPEGCENSETPEGE